MCLNTQSRPWKVTEIVHRALSGEGLSGVRRAWGQGQREQPFRVHPLVPLELHAKHMHLPLESYTDNKRHIDATSHLLPGTPGNLVAYTSRFRGMGGLPKGCKDSMTKSSIFHADLQGVYLVEPS